MTASQPHIPEHRLTISRCRPLISKCPVYLETTKEQTPSSSGMMIMCFALDQDLFCCGGEIMFKISIAGEISDHRIVKY